MSEKTFKIYTLGCKVNRYDAGVLKTELTAAGFKPLPKDADLAFVNSCAVTASAIHKNQRMLNKARQENPRAKIILLGCWPQIDKEQASKAGAYLVWGTSRQKELVKRINKLFFNVKQKNFFVPAVKAIERARYFIKIQDGCEQFCSYCVIPFARGRYQSRSREELCSEIQAAIKFGYQEIVLSGVHLGMYGREKNSIAKTGLCGLLRQILKIKGLGRIRLSSIEATEITAELIELMKNSKKICKHLHIPLQSGTDKILKLMNRPYNCEYFLNKLEKLRQAMPDIALTTDVIVGFPGETEQDFLQTVDFIKKCGFSRLHVFSFSAHKKTKAYTMPGHLGKAVIDKRSKEFRNIGKIMADEHLKKYRNKRLAVVVEAQSQGRYIGKSEYYFNISFAKKNIVDWQGNDCDALLIRKIVIIK